MTVGALLAVFGLLTGGTAAVRTGDVFLLLGLGLHLVLLPTRPTATTERDAIDQDILEITLFAHNILVNTPPPREGLGWAFLSDGTVLRP